MVAVLSLLVASGASAKAGLALDMGVGVGASVHVSTTLTTEQECLDADDMKWVIVGETNSVPPKPIYGCVSDDSGKNETGSNASATGTANMSEEGAEHSSQAGSMVGVNGSVELDISAGNSGVVITRSDVDTNSNQGVTVTHPTEVNDNVDFHAYVESKVKEDKKIEEVAATKDEVKVEYKAKAKFLGFIPFTTTVKVVSDNEGNVTVSYPWYRFLIAVDNSDDIKANVEAQARASANANLGSGSTVSAKANMVEAVVNALETTEANVDADVTGSVNY